MKLFLDTGEAQAVHKAMETGLLDGVTTNPSHIMKTGRKFHEVVKEICAICPGSISVEVMAEDTKGMIIEARELAKIAANIAIKIPMTVEGLKAVPVLEKENIPTNVTMIFSPTQCYLAMKAGATFVSLVLSRLDAVANESRLLIEDSVLIRDNYGFTSKILCASLKTQNHVMDSLRAGADIATLPTDLFFQLYKHPLTEAGLAKFKTDWQKVPK
jgi:transaldolase